MNVALERITDFWRNLGRREQALAIACVVVLLLVIVFFVLSGGEETTPIDASTSGSAQALPEQAAPPPPGAIVASKPEAQPIVPEGGGVAGINATGGGGDGGEITGARAIGAEWEQEAMKTWQDVPAIEDFPPFSAAVASAGRDLERVAQEYKVCVATRADIRPCVNVIKYGVFIDSDWHASGQGVTLSKLSSDGHRLDFTIMPDGTDCRALDNKPSCTAWSTS